MAVRKKGYPNLIGELLDNHDEFVIMQENIWSDFAKGRFNRRSRSKDLQMPNT